MPPGDRLLDDPDAIEAGDPSGMLAAVASAGAQLRAGVAAAAEARLAELAGIGPPRAVVVAGMGGSGIAGDVLAGVVGQGAPVPVVSHRGYGLPGWVGAADLVCAVSASGSTEETLSAVEEAARRGAPLVTVGAPDSALAGLSAAAGGRHVSVDAAGRQPRACIWSLSVPLLVLADAVGLAAVPASVIAGTADLVDRLTATCAPAVLGAVNRAKALARHLAGGVPMVWGSTPLAGVAARRFACQLNENSKAPAVWGEQPEASHNQVVVLDGPTAADVRLVILRDAEEEPRLARRRTVSAELAESRGVPVTEVAAHGAHPLPRLASLITLTDHASVYLALATGIDPTPIRSIAYLKERLATTIAPTNLSGGRQ
jgi:glucose/mannose-6-phosphate isomerase